MSDDNRVDVVGNLRGVVDRAESQLDSLEKARAAQRIPGVERMLPRELPTIGQFGPYDIVGRLAMGGMAEILLAREQVDENASRHLVVKRILPEYGNDPAFVNMFLDEANVMMRLRHPNVCHVYKFGQHNGEHYIAMEWIYGASLGKLIRRARKTGGVPVAVACYVAAAVAEALDHAHNAENARGAPLNLVHRDVTPDNIMISYDGSVKLLDFGIAKAEARAHQTQAGQVKGKFAYMAPEQCRGRELDCRVDIFALGVCLFETLTGRQLYRRETEFETMEAIVRGPVPRLSDRVKNPPPALDYILLRCLAKKADDRWSSASELQEALQRYLVESNEVVTARRLKELMHALFDAERKSGPVVESTPFGASFHMASDPNLAKQEELFQPKSGESAVFQDDLPLPDLELSEADAEASEGLLGLHHGHGEGIDPTENSRPGVTPAVNRAAAPPTTSLPLPTAPPRPSERPPPQARSSSPLILGGSVAAALLVLAGAGGWYFMSESTEPTASEPAQAAAAILTGAVTVTTDPGSATLFLDGEERGLTPVTVEELTMGTHAVRIELEGYAPHEGSVEIRAGRSLPVLQVLTPLPETTEDGVEEQPTGQISLTTTPTGVRVFHDGEELGVTPLPALSLPLGVVELELQPSNGPRVTRGVLVSADEVRPTHVNLD